MNETSDQEPPSLPFALLLVTQLGTYAVIVLVTVFLSHSTNMSFPTGNPLPSHIK